MLKDPHPPIPREADPTGPLDRHPRTPKELARQLAAQLRLTSPVPCWRQRRLWSVRRSTRIKRSPRGVSGGV